MVTLRQTLASPNACDNDRLLAALVTLVTLDVSVLCFLRRSS